MTLVDRFICRREGHVPAFTVGPHPWIKSFVTTCRRCGKVFEVKGFGDAK